ncbi:MAG: ATP-binding cassette domain-containing protein, partial [Rhodospirillales bacterium]|nr:ATP-binding cassette domain-containing protein [Rhodospirillales bacterium]
MSDIAVDLINVTKRFGRDILAVDEMTLHIAQGEYISFIGPSGCGKTTTLRMISGFDEPTDGQILIAGRDCTHLEPHERNTAMVFQHFALFPHMTVAQNVEFGLRMRNVPSAERSQRALEMLRAVDIAD